MDSNFLLSSSRESFSRECLLISLYVFFRQKINTVSAITDTPNKTGSAIVQATDIEMESAAIIAIAAAVATVVKAAIDIPAMSLAFLEERLFNCDSRLNFFVERSETLEFILVTSSVSTFCPGWLWTVVKLLPAVGCCWVHSLDGEL